MRFIALCAAKTYKCVITRTYVCISVSYNEKPQFAKNVKNLNQKFTSFFPYKLSYKCVSVRLHGIWAMTFLYDLSKLTFN